MGPQIDQRGVMHGYVYDDLGWLTEDRVTSLGDSNENADGSVRAIVTAYKQRGGEVWATA